MDERTKKWLYPTAITIIVSVMGVAAYFLMPWMIRIASDPAARTEFLDGIRRSGFGGIATMVGLLCLQVIVPVLPAEALQLGAGILYGTFGGAFVCLFGLTVGTMVNHMLGRFLGAETLSLFVKPDKVAKVRSLVQGGKADKVVFLLYFIPGIPKDVVAYAAGLSRYPALRFLVVSLIARFPSLLSSTYIGASLAMGDTGRAVIVFIALGVVAVPAFFFSERIMSWISRKRKDPPTSLEGQP
jgi:uncharacterized membrane protein YdjX (TVP38/TMEM64 family)